MRIKDSWWFTHIVSLESTCLLYIDANMRHAVFVVYVFGLYL